MGLPEKELFIKTPWGRISVLTWGDPKNPPILLCHGKQDVCTSFRPLIRNLPATYYYVSVDLPGNGKSDSLPKGVTLSVFDLIPSIHEIIEHFNWNNFIFIGHSLGVIIGKYYMLAYPNKVTKVVELDPVPAVQTFDHQKLGEWYHYFYGDYYEDEKYRKNNASDDTAPRITYEKALEMIMESRILSREAAEHVAERALTATSDGLYRFTFDQRMKAVMWLPLPTEYMKAIYTSITVPTLCIIAENSIQLDFYKDTPFVTQENVYKNNNYRVKIVPGYHDVHISNPERISDAITKFLNDGVQAKL